MLYKTMLTSSKRYKGTLKECWRHYDSTQLELINNVYDNEEFEDDLPKKDKIELLYQMIMRGVGSNLKDLPVHFLEDLEYLLNNENYQVKNTELLGLGLVFLSIEGDQEKYVIFNNLVFTKLGFIKIITKSMCWYFRKSCVNGNICFL